MSQDTETEDFVEGAELAQAGTRVGNTNKPRAIKRQRLRSIIFTWNNPPKDGLAQVAQWAEGRGGQYTCQEESGSEGTPHIQGFIKFKNAVEFSVIKAKWPKWHVEKAKNEDRAEAYCRKKRTRSGERISNIYFTEDEMIDPMRGKTYRPWQLELMRKLFDMEFGQGESSSLRSSSPVATVPVATVDTTTVTGTIKEADERRVHWYWEGVGNSGKTSMAKHIYALNEDLVMYVSGKAADIKHGIATKLKEGKRPPKILILDLVRTSEQYVSYEAIESLKNGFFYSTKFDSAMVAMKTPHVVIFANFLPQYEKLSADRWDIIEIQ